MSTLERSNEAPATWLVAGCLAVGTAALGLRTVSYASIAATASVGLLAFLVPTRELRQGRIRSWILITAAGIGAFWLGRALGAGIGVRLTTLGVATIVIAAIAEEAFFRRLMFSWCTARTGVVGALLVTSVLFAVIHLPIYGTDVFWIDLAAGALLGWQRWVTGTWTAPAVTHVVANLLQMG